MGNVVRMILPLFTNIIGIADIADTYHNRLLQVLYMQQTIVGMELAAISIELSERKGII